MADEFFFIMFVEFIHVFDAQFVEFINDF